MKQHHWNRTQQRLLEDFLDGELDAKGLTRVDTLLRTDARFREEVRLYRRMLAGLAAMPRHEPPLGFDAPILAAILPHRVQEAVLVRAATRMYLALSVVLSGAVLSLLAFLFRGQGVEGTTATGLTGLVDAVLTGFAGVGRAILSAVLVVDGVLTPLVTALRPLANGLGSAAQAAAPSLVPLLSATVLLAALVLSWALHSNRKKGMSHASLSL